VPVTLAHHHRVRGLHPVHHATQIDIDHPVPMSDRQLLDVPADTDAGVVDHQVQPAVPLHGLGHHRGNIAAAFKSSERSVRRIVESLSADVEKPQDPTPPTGSAATSMATASCRRLLTPRRLSTNLARVSEPPAGTPGQDAEYRVVRTSAAAPNPLIGHWPAPRWTRSLGVPDQRRRGPCLFK
jgi:hypothetical protein